jgi:formate hydrogenlyase transcriptional activator
MTENGTTYWNGLMTGGPRTGGALADQAAVTVESALSDGALWDEWGRVDLSLQLAAIIRSNLELRELLRVVSGSIRRAMRCHGVGVMLPDLTTKELRLFACDCASTDEGVFNRIAARRLGPEAAFRTGKPVVGHRLDAAAFTSNETYRLAAESGVKAMCDLPLISRERVVGILVLSSQSEGTFSPGDVDFLLRATGQVAIVVDNALAYAEIHELKKTLARETLSLEDEIPTERRFEEIVGRSAALRRVLKQAETVAPTDSTVLLYGETGTGKELIARGIHNLSPRCPNTFVKLNCAAIPTGLLESELFGHEKGAFTGAIAQRIGRFEQAHGGTIFLDEVGEIPLELQTKLLRVLQEREFERLGGARTLRADSRVIAATNRDLSAMVKEQRYRADLFYRLNVFPIHIPPLRERREDIPLLVRHFVQFFATRMNRTIETIPSETMEALSRYRWPGNIREMQNLIERAVISSFGSVLQVPLRDLKAPATADPDPGLHQTLTEVERAHILAILKDTGWVVSGPDGAATRLGMNRSTLQFRMRKLGIVRRGSNGTTH